MHDWFARTHEEIKYLPDQQAAAQTDTQLVGAAKRQPDSGASEEDPDAEHIVVGVEFSASAALNFYLQNANGAGGRKSITFYAGANSGDFHSTWIPMGRQKPIKYTSSAGTLSLRVAYITRRYSTARALKDA